MKKTVLLSSLLTILLLSDSNLGQKISVASAQEEIIQDKEYQESPQRLETRLSPQNVKNSFKSDHHRYDKRYRNFNYEREGYYNDEGLYFGYYDTRGYFYNNIFFAYNRNYSYNDRRYRRGFFRRGHQHHRPYVHHTFNDWNRVHCYREPNVIVRGHYDDPHYYPTNSHTNVVHNHYYNSPSRYNNPHHNHVRGNYHRPHNGHARMNVTRMQNNRLNTRQYPRNYDRNQPHHMRQNPYRNNPKNPAFQRDRPRGNYTRMQTRGSTHPHKSRGGHMGISK